MNKKEYMKQYRLRNKKRLQKYQKEWRNKNRDKVNAERNVQESGKSLSSKRQEETCC